MLKRIIPIVLCLTLLFSISAMAENNNAEESANAPGVTQEMPQSENISSSGKTPPSDMKMPQGENGFGGGKMPPSDMKMPQGGNGFGGGKMPPSDMQMPQSENSSESSQTTPSDTQIPQEEDSSESENAPIQDGNGFPGMPNDSQETEAEQETGFLGFVKTYSTPLMSVVLLMLAFVFVVFYKRKHY